MASVRNLKKDINNVLGDVIEAVYLTEAANDKQDSKEGAEIIDEAISDFDELIVQVNKKDVDNRRKHLKEVRKELQEKAAKLVEKVNNME
ncbi:hypothetical protein RQM65_03880 [Pricia sp. S334]|uniref:Uncharacterized protein n=1 Tax=Pricia mediterranea TaxID=3076079 RepID=A0ABU3L239_9FLAO|nr:hypothetical protein [Pricia sp. S334]MDT7827804.1 hypothetical protein [Pricia sp. S334]